MAKTRARGLPSALDEVPVSRFHLRAVLVSGMGFFTDAYDLFVIGIAATLIRQQWHLGSGQLALLNSTMLAAAFLGALVFGRVADLLGRTRVYWLVAVIMVLGALGSALAPSFWVLIVFRFVLGFGVGGDYPVSAVLMSEYANRRDRGRLVGMVFSTQALGLIVAPLIALALLGGGVSDGLAWRIMLGLGAVPAAAVLYLRRRLPESPRYQAQIQGRHDAAVDSLARFSEGRVMAVPSPAITHQMGLRSFLTNRRWLLTLAWHGRLLVPAGLRLLRQHDLHAPDHRADLAAFVHHDHDRHPAGHLRGRRGAGLPARRRPDGPRRPPAAPADRLRHDGAVLRGHRAGARADHRGGTVPAGLRGQLLLHRVRPEHDHVRDAQ